VSLGRGRRSVCSVFVLDSTRGRLARATIPQHTDRYTSPAGWRQATRRQEWAPGSTELLQTLVTAKQAVRPGAGALRLTRKAQSHHSEVRSGRPFPKRWRAASRLCCECMARTSRTRPLTVPSMRITIASSHMSVPPQRRDSSRGRISARELSVGLLADERNG
jgi:hypothetical protein